VGLTEEQIVIVLISSIIIYQFFDIYVFFHSSMSMSKLSLSNPVKSIVVDDEYMSNIRLARVVNEFYSMGTLTVKLESNY
jgi:hypothetical protein